MKKVFTSIFLLALSLNIMAQQAIITKQKGRTKYIKHKMETMTLKQMVGQMIMIDSYAKDDSNYYKNVLYQIDSNEVGGVCFFKGTQKELVKLNKIYNQHSKIPLLVAIDGEWGMNMRLTDAETFPVAMTLGALPKDKYHLVRDMAEVMAKQCKDMGIHINFAPVVDVNINPNNPVINMRSFGQDKYKVSLLAREYVKGLQDNGIMAVIKHFPGHGDTEIDSHKATPSITHSKDFIDSIDTYPFRYNINKGAWGVMVGHLQVNALSQDSTKPASINKDIIDKYLKKDLKFEGLVFTDAMNMKGLTNLYGDGEAEVLAVLSGVDIILMPENTDKAINAILAAVENGRIPKELIKKKCEKILAWKYDMGLYKKRGEYSIPNSSLQEKTTHLNKLIAENTITVLGNTEEYLNPLKHSKTDSISLVLLGNTSFDTLINNLSNTYAIKPIYINSKMKNKDIDSLVASLNPSAKIVTAFGGARFSSSKARYGIPDNTMHTLNSIAQKFKDNNVVLMLCNPYVFKMIDSSYKCKAFVVGYENNSYTQQAIARLLKGEISAKGSLPVKVKQGSAVEVEEVTDEDKFYMDNNISISIAQRIDSIALNGIKEKAYPGCQILIAKDGKIMYDKTFGYYTYDKKREVSKNTLYDIASLTKVMATTLAVMKLYEQNKINLDSKISTYIPELKKQQAGELTVKELLSHYTTLPAVYPFHKKKLKDKDIHKAILKEMKNVPLSPQKYVYSDLNFLLLQYMVENITNESLDEYLQREFYAPMNLQNTTFNPLLNGVATDNIAPTENDTIVRKQLICDEVHDPLAYLNNGVCGNAGLFSTAEDLFKICQMLLNKGSFNNRQYLKPSTINAFNKRYFADKGIRRALGFDKPLINGNSVHCSKYASQSSFGHSGFTGTYLWIDPENNTIFIFLSNRVYPTSTPNRLAQMNIRTDINDLIYQMFK